MIRPGKTPRRPGWAALPERYNPLAGMSLVEAQQIYDAARGGN